MWNPQKIELLPMPSMNKELTHPLLIINNTTVAQLLDNRVASAIEFSKITVETIKVTTKLVSSKSFLSLKLHLLYLQ